jgi:hypothetical protein
LNMSLLGEQHSQRWPGRLLLGSVGVVAGLTGACGRNGGSSQEQPAADAASFGPRDEASVYSVGHSLINSKEESFTGFTTVMEGVKTLSKHAGQKNSYFDHTLFGAPLSLNWQGHPDSYPRDEPSMLERRRELDEHPERYDTLVMTEALPLGWQMQGEHSAYYARKFLCALRTTNPSARVYLYEGWPHLHASDPGGGYPAPADWDFPAEVRKLRVLWDTIAEQASRGEVTQPSLFRRVSVAVFGDSSDCGATGPVHIVPVASALALLHERLESPPNGESWTHESGEAVTMADLFANPLATYPPKWPGGKAPSDKDRERVLSAMPRRKQNKDLDDIHPSQLGIYFASLVSYATLYGRDPTGGPSGPGVSPELAKLLQRVAWEAVSSDPKSGVSAVPSDGNRPTNTPPD